MGTLRQHLEAIAETYEAQAAEVRREIGVVGATGMLDTDFTSMGAVHPYSTSDTEDPEGPVYVVLPAATHEAYESLAAYLAETFGEPAETYSQGWLQIMEFSASSGVTVRLTSSIDRDDIAESDNDGTLFG